MDAYVNRLRKLASSCDFGTLTDELIRDRLVIGVRDRDLKGRILRQKGLSLQKALEISKSNEVTKQQLTSLETKKRTAWKSRYTSKNRKADRDKRSLKKPPIKVPGNRTTRKWNQIRRKKEQMEKAKHLRKESASIVAIRRTVKEETVLRLARCVVSAIKAITSRQSAMPNSRIQ